MTYGRSTTGIHVNEIQHFPFVDPTCTYIEIVAQMLHLLGPCSQVRSMRAGSRQRKLFI